MRALPSAASEDVACDSQAQDAVADGGVRGATVEGGGGDAGV